MADDTNTTISQGRPEGAGRNNRQGGGRDSGGFRIRLSDNELQAARALQEALQLRSTVAVLGFSLRTLAQMLEDGQLDELVARQRAQGGGRPAPRSERGERRNDHDRGAGGRPGRVDPFARPARPAPAPAAETGAETAEDTALPEESIPASAETEAVQAEEPTLEAGSGGGESGDEGGDAPAA